MSLACVVDPIALASNGRGAESLTRPGPQCAATVGMSRTPKGRVTCAAVFSLLLAGAPALAQTPPASQSAAPTDPGVLLDQIAGLIDRGKLHIIVDLQAGRAAIAPDWTAIVTGAPKATLPAQAGAARARPECISVC